jgi:hypothetical protein
MRPRVVHKIYLKPSLAIWKKFQTAGLITLRAMAWKCPEGLATSAVGAPLQHQNIRSLRKHDRANENMRMQIKIGPQGVRCIFFPLFFGMKSFVTVRCYQPVLNACPFSTDQSIPGAEPVLTGGSRPILEVKLSSSANIMVGFFKSKFLTNHAIIG